MFDVLTFTMPFVIGVEATTAPVCNWSEESAPFVPAALEEPAALVRLIFSLVAVVVPTLKSVMMS